MDTIDKIDKIAMRYARGVITRQEFLAEVTEILVEDRRQIVEATRAGTLATAHSDGSVTVG